jgi:hypothetical protein
VQLQISHVTAVSVDRDLGSNGKASWSKPIVRKLEAGSAEAGANPVNPEGVLQGS